MDVFKAATQSYIFSIPSKYVSSLMAELAITAALQGNFARHLEAHHHHGIIIRPDQRRRRACSLDDFNRELKTFEATISRDLLTPQTLSCPLEVTGSLARALTN